MIMIYTLFLGIIVVCLRRHFNDSQKFTVVLKLVKFFINDTKVICYDRVGKIFFRAEVNVVRKWLIWMTVIVAVFWITTDFSTSWTSQISLSKVSLLEHSSVTCDSSSTVEIDASCIYISEFPDSLIQNQTFEIKVIDPQSHRVLFGLSFSSSNPQIASIDADGWIKALSAGQTSITISHSSGFSESYDLSVESRSTTVIQQVRLSVLNPRKTIVQGESYAVDLKVSPSSLTSKVRFTSSDISVASIDQNGLIRAISPGKTIIKASVEGVSSSFSLEVIKKNEIIKYQSLSIVSASSTMEMTTSQTLSIKKSPADANEPIEFISSDPTVLSVSSLGRVTALAIGTATVTVRNLSGTVSAKITIKVVECLDIDRLIRDVFRLTNQERINAGLPALTYNSVLENGALIRAEEIIQSFSHTRPNGTKFYTVFEGLYDYRMIGENLAAGFTSASSVVSGWMNSEGHRANILKEDYTEIGIGIKKDSAGRLYWVQIFGTPK